MEQWKLKLEMVREFYLKFGQEKYLGQGLSQTEERRAKRRKWLEEEKREYAEALESNDKAAILDALCDMEYIRLGTLLERADDIGTAAEHIWIDGDHELDRIHSLTVMHDFEDVFFEAFQEVHRSNMSKLGLDGRPVYKEDGKIGKGPNFFEPNLRQFFEEAKSE